MIDMVAKIRAIRLIVRSDISMTVLLTFPPPRASICGWVTSRVVFNVCGATVPARSRPRVGPSIPDASPAGPDADWSGWLGPLVAPISYSSTIESHLSKVSLTQPRLPRSPRHTFASSALWQAARHDRCIPHTVADSALRNPAGRAEYDSPSS